MKFLTYRVGYRKECCDLEQDRSYSRQGFFHPQHPIWSSFCQCHCVLPNLHPSQEWSLGAEPGVGKAWASQEWPKIKTRKFTITTLIISLCKARALFQVCFYLASHEAYTCGFFSLTIRWVNKNPGRVFFLHRFQVLFVLHLPQSLFYPH